MSDAHCPGTLGGLIARLEREPDHAVAFGFYNPHYRGHYEQLAFEPKRDTTVGAMLEAARSASGGLPGLDAPVWLSERGRGGETLGPILLEFMLTGRPE